MLSINLKKRKLYYAANNSEWWVSSGYFGIIDDKLKFFSYQTWEESMFEKEHETSAMSIRFLTSKPNRTMLSNLNLVSK